MSGMEKLSSLVFMALMVIPGCEIIRPHTTRLLGEARVRAPEVRPPQLELPVEPRRRPGASEHLSQLGEAGATHSFPQALVREWAGRPLPDWQEEGKVQAPRVLLAKLILGVDIADVNAYIRAAEPWSGIGSTWGLRPNGDYDFSLPPLTAILYLFGEQPDRLYPETRDHLLEVLLTEEGGRFRTTVPGSMGLVTETENHVLMTEGSRYLKNQWLFAHGSEARSHDNSRNGMEEKLVSFLDDIREAGAFEYNSYPYLGYTVMATLLLEAFAEKPVADAARAVLDNMNWEYALGSFRLRRYAPYRRQSRRRGITDLHDHPHTSVMASWMSWSELEDGATEAALDRVAKLESNRHHAFFAAIMPYRLPAPLAEFVDSGGAQGLVRIGRGPGVSPEIYSRGRGYLISAGGTGNGSDGEIVPRPTVVLLDDGARELEDVLHIVPAEEDYRRWNNSGVSEGLAVGRGGIHVPPAWEPATHSGGWRVYDREEVLIATSELDGVAVIVALDREDAVAYFAAQQDSDHGNMAQGVAEALARRNGGSAITDGSVVTLDGTEVRFEVDAPLDTWVIAEYDGAEQERSFARWPRNTGSPGASRAARRR